MTRDLALRSVLSGEVVTADPEDPWILWADAVRRMASGDYRSALRDFGDLADPNDRIPEELRGLAAAAFGSGLRQLGRHTDARPWDEQAAATVGAGRVDGLIGLAADWLGSGGFQEADGYLQDVEPLLADPRDHIRCSWVRAELALARDAPESARSFAEAALTRASGVGAVRHRIKSSLILGVAEVCCGQEGGRDRVRGVIADAQELELLPLVRAAVLALGVDATAEERQAGEDAAAVISRP